MRQKKSKKILYISAIVTIGLIGFIVSRDVTVNIEHVEEVVDSSILNK